MGHKKIKIQLITSTGIYWLGRRKGYVGGHLKIMYWGRIGLVFCFYFVWVLWRHETQATSYHLLYSNIICWKIPLVVTADIYFKYHNFKSIFYLSSIKRHNTLILCGSFIITSWKLFSGWYLVCLEKKSSYILNSIYLSLE